MRQVKADYDFAAQLGTGEMSLIAGEILTVVREGVEGGWMEARNSKGETGLVPEGYVSPHFGASPPLVPPPPSAPLAKSSSGVSARPLDDWGASSFVPSAQTIAPNYTGGSTHSATSLPAPASLPPRPVSHSTINDDFDDEWTDDDEEQPDQAHRLSVQDECSAGLCVSRVQSRAQSRATSGSRTDLSTDDESKHLSTLERERERRRRSSSKEGNQRRQSRQLGKTMSTKEPAISHGHGSMSIAGNDARGAISRSHSAGGTERTGGSRINRNINRFSNFVKSGMESYILNDNVISVPQSEKLEIVHAGQYNSQWRPIDQYYTCTVDKPKKESKMKGLKSFIAYSLTSSISGIQVSRRYKHFDWLHERLSAKYIMIPIPPLPEKQVSGLYEEDLIEHRKHILQLWVNKICRHPVLSKCEVWLHFISCTDEKQWKEGKRKAEKDTFVGGNFFYSVSFPQHTLSVNDVERHVEVFQRSIRSMDDSVRVMSERLLVFQKLFSGPVKQNWQKMAAAFSSLGQSFEADNNPGSTKMVEALKHTAHHYHAVGDDFEKHTREDMEPMLENLYSYKGTVQAVPDILHVHKQAVGKLRETERAASEGKVNQNDAERIKKRVESASHMLMAEMSHLNQEKVEDFRCTIGDYLKKQAAFYQKMANTLNDLANHYQ